MGYMVEGLSLGMGEREDERRFVWLQDVGYTGARVRLAPLALYERDGGFTEENSRIVSGVTAPVERDTPRLSCRVRVDGLAADTAYIYTVGCDGAWDGECYRFRMPACADGRSFFMIADLHINVYRRPFHVTDPEGKRANERYGNTLQSAIGYAGHPDFMLSLGDNISVCNMGAGMYPEPEKYSKRLSAEYAMIEHLEFLAPRALKEIPFATVQGNHDAVLLPRGEAPVGDGNNALFDLPHDDGYAGHYMDGAPCDGRTISAGNFWFKSGGVLVVGINAMAAPTGNCTPCAPEVHRAYIERAVAAAPDVRWRILLCHVPAYSYVEGAEVRAAGTTSGKPSEPTERAKMADFFNDLCDPFGFDVVFTGHQHAFSRTYPLVGGRPVGEEGREVATAPGGTVTETLTRPRGAIHYNVASAYDESFVSNLPADPAALYPAYGVKLHNLMGALGRDVPNVRAFDGITYNSPIYTHVKTDGDTMRIASVRSDNGEEIDVLIIHK